MAVVAGGAVVVVADGCSVVAEDEDEDDDGAESNSAAPLCCCASSMLSSVLNALEMFGVSASKARAADTAASAPPSPLLLSTPAPTTISTKKQTSKQTASKQQAITFALLSFLFFFLSVVSAFSFWQVKKNAGTKAKFRLSPPALSHFHPDTSHTNNTAQPSTARSQTHTDTETKTG